MGDMADMVNDDTPDVSIDALIAHCISKDRRITELQTNIMSLKGDLQHMEDRRICDQETIRHLTARQAEQENDLLHFRRREEALLEEITSSSHRIATLEEAIRELLEAYDTAEWVPLKTIDDWVNQIEELRVSYGY